MGRGCSAAGCCFRRVPSTFSIAGLCFGHHPSSAAVLPCPAHAGWRGVTCSPKAVHCHLLSCFLWCWLGAQEESPGDKMEPDPSHCGPALAIG